MLEDVIVGHSTFRDAVEYRYQNIARVSGDARDNEREQERIDEYIKPIIDDFTDKFEVKVNEVYDVKESDRVGIADRLFRRIRDDLWVAFDVEIFLNCDDWDRVNYTLIDAATYSVLVNHAARDIGLTQEDLSVLDNTLYKTYGHLDSMAEMLYGDATENGRSSGSEKIAEIEEFANSAEYKMLEKFSQAFGKYESAIKEKGSIYGSYDDCSIRQHITKAPERLKSYLGEVRAK